MKPTVVLSGEDGNVFNIIGRCKRAAREAGWDKEQMSELTQRMLNADSYDTVIQIAMSEFEVE
jgi:hypothetical protein